MTVEKGQDGHPAILKLPGIVTGKVVSNEHALGDSIDWGLNLGEEFDLQFMLAFIIGIALAIADYRALLFSANRAIALRPAQSVRFMRWSSAARLSALFIFLAIGANLLGPKVFTLFAFTFAIARTWLVVNAILSHNRSQHMAHGHRVHTVS